MSRGGQGGAVRRDVVALLGLLLGGGWLSAGAQAGAPFRWPIGPVRIVSPLAPGGPNDVSARIIAERLAQRTGQPFVVENRSGADTRIGNEWVARARPDGATLLYAAATLAVLPSLYQLPYDWRRDLAPVTLAVRAPLFLVVNAASPAKTVAEFAAHVKAKPDGPVYAGPGVGSIPHLVTELLMRRLGVPGPVVQFRGDAAAYTELLAGRVDAMVSVLSAALPYVRLGRLRVLAAAGDVRSSLLPDVPTLAESGVADVSGSSWFGFLAPTGTHAETIGAIHDAVRDALSDASVRQRLLDLGMQPVANTPTEFAASIDSEARKWGEIIRQARIKAA